MMSSRRAFLKSAGFAPAVAVTGLSAAAAPFAGELCRAHFEPLAGERFVFEQDVFEKVAATLRAAVPLEEARDGNRCFRLVFEAEPCKRLAQGSYRVTHAAIGTVVMFVSPNDAEGRLSEAVFNRL
jgi:hypothetical protein